VGVGQTVGVGLGVQVGLGVRVGQTVGLGVVVGHTVGLGVGVRRRGRCRTWSWRTQGGAKGMLKLKVSPGSPYGTLLPSPRYRL